MPTSLWHAIIENIVRLSGLGLSQEEFSRISGLSQGAILKVLRGIRESNGLTQILHWHLLKTITSKEDSVFCIMRRRVFSQRPESGWSLSDEMDAVALSASSKDV